MRFYLLLSSILLLTAVGFKHNHYIGLCLIDYKPNSQTLEISQKLFTDDFEKCLRQRFNKELFLNTEKERPKTDSLLLVYLKEHVEFRSNGKALNFNYVGHEGNLDATWCYLEIPNIKSAEDLSIVNTLMTEVFPSQTHMIKWNNSVEKKSYVARKDESEVKLD